MKKSKTTTEKAAPKVKAEQPITTGVTKATPKKPSPDQKTPKKAQVVTPKPVGALPEIAMPERVGLTAGDIWHYLTENGATSVAKLVRELPEEEKIIQRSIGWLAQEGKITLDTVDRVETVALKG
jgi:predicted DNA-binding transcriptional regulator AlpA